MRKKMFAILILLQVTLLPLTSYSQPVVKAAESKTQSKKIMVAIDAGHQSKGNYETEPIGPGAKDKKAKVSSGTQGTYTKVPEYKLTLVIAKKVKKELLKRGYDVYMIRDKNDVNLSNKERAELANKSGADIFIRIHADGSTDPDVHGTSTLYPSKDNPYVSDLSKDSKALSEAVVNAMCHSTGAKNRGTIARDDMSGINWCKLPVTIIEMGYMTNKKEDKLMQTKKYQNKLVQGICDGIDEYFQ
jgi:N-acetylmuramoyl-L-alanine amidase